MYFHQAGWELAKLEEKQTILNALAQVRGDKDAAARLLKIKKITLDRKLKEYKCQN
jgi:transcriptional regulator with PAS, ATPase and Fis domain